MNYVSTENSSATRSIFSLIYGLFFELNGKHFVFDESDLSEINQLKWNWYGFNHINDKIKRKRVWWTVHFTDEFCRLEKCSDIK